MFVSGKNTASSLNIYTVARRTVTSTISGSGNVEPQLQSNVNFKVAGTLTEIDVHVGDHVSAGQKLAAIESSAQKNAVDQAAANVATAQANLQAVVTPVTQNQVTELQNNVASAQQTYNDTVAQVNLTNTQDANQLDASQNETKPNQIASARAQVASAQAALQTAQQNLNNTTLVAPMDGEVNSINGVVGEGVSPGGGTTAEAPGTQAPLPTSSASTGFMVIGDVSGMDVVIPFAESDASRLAFNQDAQVTFDAVANLTISGHVIAVATAATNASGVVNYYVTIALNQTNKALKQGMTANAAVTVSKATNAIVVPNLAISHVAGQAFVNVYAGGQQVQTPIETGVVGDQFTEVTGGLNESEQVVIPTVKAASGTGNTRGGGGLGGGGGVQVRG